MYHKLCALVIGAAVAAHAHSADLNGDCTVNVHDLLILLSQWGSCDPPCPADFTGSGSVGVFDLLALLGAWGEDVCGMSPIGAMFTERSAGENIDYVGIPSTLVNNDFTMVAWFERVEDTTNFRNPIELRSSTAVVLAPRFTDVRVGSQANGGNTSGSTVISNIIGNKVLVAIVWDASAQTVNVHAIHEGGSGSHTASLGTSLNAPDRFRVHGSLLGGKTFTWAIRPGEKWTLADIAIIFNASPRPAHSPLTHNNGLNLNGIIAGGYGVAQAPTGVGVTALGGARIGSAVASGNYLIYHGEGGVGNLFTARPITTSDLTYKYDDSGFFEFTVPAVESGTIGNAPTMASWANGEPQKLHRINICGNSRVARVSGSSAVGSQGDEFNYAGSYPCGFALHKRELLAGYAHYIPGSTARWPICDYPDEVWTDGAARTPTGAQATGSFNRTWLGGSGGTDQGNGRPWLIGDGDEISAKFRELPDSLFLSSAPALAEYYFLRYPGSRGVIGQKVEAAAQNVRGDDVGDPFNVNDLDTTEHTRTLTASDSYNSGTRVLTIDDGFAGGYLPDIGDVMFIVSGDGAQQINQIEDVQESGGDVLLTFRFAFTAGDPATGSACNFGPFDYKVVSDTLPASAEEYRGIHFTGGDTGDGPAVLCANGAFRQGVNGFAFLMHSLNGFANQMSGAFDGVVTKMAEVYQAEESWMTDAYQGPGSLGSHIATTWPEYASQLEAGGSRPVFVIGMANNFTASGESIYRSFAFGQTDYPVICVTDSQIIGDLPSSFGYGGVQNASHPAIEAFLRVAEAVEELASLDFMPPSSRHQ